MTDMSDPLENIWTVWYHEKQDKDKNQNWSSSMKEVLEFSTLESFWHSCFMILYPSQLFIKAHDHQIGNDNTINAVSLFKKGIRPEWEDPMNIFGGELVCRCSLSPKQLDMCWELIVLGIIGETFDTENDVCGCRIVDKTKNGKVMFKYEIWLSNQDVTRAGLVHKRCDEALKKYVSACHGLEFGLVIER
mmetsp:Transcript_20197/g.20297  ORF Transcript_20197/g.20297 Transcript_20197/m.20297 type:complete len:190 (+) Transcript_20197:248-817(+)|eukprot:CAMPEP_0182436088 /NCGR_PEP_ID=MMETSP1167-20130531/79496_1 /TAXON_ID=2988 /ORGANISM="Mallomonas Sp, Strain CCMP3275" /LENGTH=189 /DNA_ID=CAMNT_0024627857 /DNA_START=139 /DNA_END=708 /DNA_ORIENTATION=+